GFQCSDRLPCQPHGPVAQLHPRRIGFQVSHRGQAGYETAVPKSGRLTLEGRQVRRIDRLVCRLEPADIMRVAGIPALLRTNQTTEVEEHQGMVVNQDLITDPANEMSIEIPRCKVDARMGDHVYAPV